MKNQKSWRGWTLSIWFLFSLGAFGAPTKDSATYLLPFNCSELMPDNTPFVNFFESVGRGQILSNKTLSKQIFKVLALREKLNQKPDLFQGINPIDVLIRRTLCYYREQKDALQVVPYYEPKLLGFLGQSMKDLEKTVESTLLDLQLQVLNQEELGRRARQNDALVAAERGRAQQSANQIFDQIAKDAVRKVKRN
jgi:hypothetical protein